METLLAILRDLRPDVDFTTARNLLEGGVLDSLDIVVLMGEISDKFKVKISVDDLMPENFESAGTIMALVQSFQQKQS